MIFTNLGIAEPLLGQDRKSFSCKDSHSLHRGVSGDQSSPMVICGLQGHLFIQQVLPFTYYWSDRVVSSGNTVKCSLFLRNFGFAGGRRKISMHKELNV